MLSPGHRKLRTTAYKPSTNGALERFHRTLNSMLAKVVEDHHRDWDDRLQSVMAAYRASPHSSTGFSPNYVLLGRECRAPLDLLVGPPPEEEDRWGSTDAYVFHQQKIKREAYQLVRQHLRTTAERSKDRYDMRVKPGHFTVGQWVYVYCPRRYQGRNPKWTKWYSKPMLITKILGPVNVLVQKGPRAKGQVIHLDKLKRCEGSTPRSWLAAEPGEEPRAAAVPTAVELEEAPLSVPDNDEMPEEEETAADVAAGTKPLDGGGPARTTPPAATTASPTPRVQPKRNAGIPRRYLQRGHVEEQCERTVFRMHSLRCC